MDSPTTPQQRILSVLEGGVRTWDALKGLTKINDERLGFTIGELLDLRKIWTTQINDVRVYGIERRNFYSSPITVEPARRTYIAKKCKGCVKRRIAERSDEAEVARRRVIWRVFRRLRQS